VIVSHGPRPYGHRARALARRIIRLHHAGGQSGRLASFSTTMTQPAATRSRARPPASS